MAASARVRRQHVDVAHQEQAVVQAPKRDTLRVGAVNDPAEADADRLAQQALSVAQEYGGGGPASGPALTSSAGIHRLASSPLAGELDIEASTLRRAGSGGAALDGGVRERLETGFGRDLSDVRVHTGAAAADLAADIGARAFTHGSDIYFGKGEYQPSSPAGTEVLAHEVAHTVQASDGVHRYPDTAMTAPVAWSQQTESVFRPGGGVSGGVYIMKTNVRTDTVQKAVAKPIFGQTLAGEESGEQLVVGDRILGALLGLKTPTSRIVKKGTAEFADLVQVCAPHQPPVDPNAEGADLWKPLAEAEAFVVMSEVPNAKSVQGLVDDAANDMDGARDLVRTIFNADFLRDLGKLMIGDILIGNPDRLIFGADNIGNVMVSMQNGVGSLFAIDSTAMLKKYEDPGAFHGKGNLTERGSAIEEMNFGPEVKVDRFFAVIVDQLKSKTQGNPEVPIWQRIENGYARNRGAAVKAFTAGWDDGLAVAMTLAGDNGEEFMDLSMKGLESKNVNKEGLKTNATYLTSRAKGEDKPLARAAAMNLSQWARAFDRAPLAPSADELSAKVFTPPSKHQLGAEWVKPASLPTHKDLKASVPTATTVPPAKTEVVRSGVVAAHGEVDTDLAPKKRGIIGMKKSVPRDRAVLAHAVVNAHAVVAGAGRLVHATGRASFVAYTINDLLEKGVSFQGSEAAPVKALAEYVDGLPQYLGSAKSQYSTVLGQVATMLPKTDFGKGPEGAQVLTLVGAAQEALGRMDEKFGQIRNRAVSQQLANL